VAVRRRGGSGASRCYKDETHLFGVVCLVEVNFGSRAKYIGTDSGAHWSLIKGLPLIRAWGGGLGHLLIKSTGYQLQHYIAPPAGWIHRQQLIVFAIK
jgi:hypothetical protein